jgi:hypothetical protein
MTDSIEAFACECCGEIVLRAVSGEWKLTSSEAYQLRLDLEQAMAERAYTAELAAASSAAESGDSPASG